MSEGAFEIVGQGLDDYNIKPRSDLQEPIPQEQRELQNEVYRTRGILKHLEEQGMFGGRGVARLIERIAVRGRAGGAPEQEEMLREFKERLRQIAESGLTGDYVRVQHSAEALQHLRQELLIRKGNAVKYRYLAHLAGWAALGVALGGLVYLTARWGATPWPEGYGLLVMGAVVGAWLSVAANRWSVSFEDLPHFLDSAVEPAVRILFVTVLAVAVGVALQAGLLQIELGGADLARFAAGDTAAQSAVDEEAPSGSPEDPEAEARGQPEAGPSGAPPAAPTPDATAIALLLGLVTGVSERALATRLIESARTVAEK